MMHTIVEAVHYLSTTWLTDSTKVTVFTVGHSLGGGLATIFAYLWVGMKQEEPYKSNSTYTKLNEQIVCVSLGSPRVLGKTVATKFCNLVKNGTILLLRLSTFGDPVISLPFKGGFQHPCSDVPDMRKLVSEACRAQLTMRPLPNVQYTGALRCKNVVDRIYVTNPLSHTIYLNIVYTKAVDLAKFFRGMVVKQEVARTPKQGTVCRLVIGEHGSDGTTSTYRVVFFEVDEARIHPSGNADAIEETKLADPANTDATTQAELQTMTKPEDTTNPVEEPPGTGPTTDAAANTNTTGGGMFSSVFSRKPAAATATATTATTHPATVAATTAATQPVASIPATKSRFSFGGAVAEDQLMTDTAFQALVQQATQLGPSDDKCPNQYKTLAKDAFASSRAQPRPSLTCPHILSSLSSTTGGGKRGSRRHTQRHHHTRKRRHTQRRRHHQHSRVCTCCHRRVSTRYR
jgi:hypothetical protein